MERVTISMSDELAAELAAFMETEHYDNRSEAVRDLARLGLKKARIDQSVINQSVAGQCVATLSYVFNHHTRELSKRLTETHHAHHDLQVATLHVHLDHESCLEVAILRGDAVVVRAFAKTVVAERGVKHGEISFVPVTIDAGTHDHAQGSHGRNHAHTRPLE